MTPVRIAGATSLRSLQTGRAEYIAERKTLAAAGDPFVHLRLSNADYRFSGGAWSTTCGQLMVFDPVFVSENVYSGEYVELEQRRNLYLTVVGASGVLLARQIESLDDQIRRLNITIREKKSTIESLLPSGITLDAYLAWGPVANVDSRIALKEREVSDAQRAADRAAEIISKEPLSTIGLPVIPANFEEILAKKLTDIASDAEELVRRQLDVHEMGDKGEDWLSQGLAYVRKDLCPFCGQSVKANPIVRAYQTYFDESYRTLKREVVDLGQAVTISVGETAVSAVRAKISDNLTLLEFWRQFGELDVPSIDLAALQSNYASLLNSALQLVQCKQQNPLEAVEISSGFATAIEQIRDFGQSVAECNVEVEKANAAIQSKKDAAGQGVDVVGPLRRELGELEAKKRRFEPATAQTCEDYESATQDKGNLEGQKRLAREQLDQHCEQIIPRHQDDINDYLNQFNVGFRIANSSHGYEGGTPSSQYQVELNNIAVDLGSSRTPVGTPCFRTALSTGDRSALALAFFMALLKQDSELPSRVVVFDDPFTSLDRFRRACTQQMIGQLAGSAEQVIVLSHDPDFLKLLWEDATRRNTPCKALKMFKHGDTTLVGQWDIEEEVKPAYLQDFSTLLKFYRERAGNPREVVRSIRPFLETWLRSHFPGQFQPDTWLGEFLIRIRDADPSSGLQHAKVDLTELESINDYSKKYHHSENLGVDREPIDQDELHGYVKRTLRFVGES